jgi:hypothetical protein
MFAVQEILAFALLAGVLAAAVLFFTWRWARQRYRYAIVGCTTSLGFAAWNFALNATNATGFNVDAPIIPLSWADVGSGVLAFATTALVLGLVLERQQPAGRVVGAAAIAGLVAVALDLFVL